MPASWYSVKAGIAKWWGSVLEAALVLWVTRVSVVSAVFGTILFIYIPQVHDTFLEVRTDDVRDLANIAFWLLFLLSAVFLWALPVHYAARLDLDFDPAFTGKPRSASATWIPRLLAALCLASVAIGAYRAQGGLLSPQGTPFYEDALLQTRWIMWMAILLAIAVIAFLTWRQDLFARLPHSVGKVLMGTLALSFFVLFVLPPVFVSRELLWRAPLIPLLLGGWVPVLAWLAQKGRKFRVPFILLLMLGLEGMAYFGDNHEVRRLWIDDLATATRVQPEPDAGFSRERIRAAIERWQTANKCAGRPDACPRPIVVAASGGASRAGFFTAGVLGELMDRSIATQGATRRNLRGLYDFRRQLFAISTVSGSSTGAAFFVAALRHWDDAKANLSKAEQRAGPCREDPENLVFFEGKAKGWRQCMEQLLAGDFISPTLYGLVYKDAIRGLAPVARQFGMNMPDRAVFLERAWEDRFCLNLEGEVCRDDDQDGMRAPFLSSTGHAGRPTNEWTPILLLNATDASTGRRVVISPLNPRMDGRKWLFPDAYDLHELLADETERGSGPRNLWDRSEPRSIVRDIPLSTAAHLSARFPIVSPPGNIRNGKEQIISRIIDGGYFENFGAATALDIVRQLKMTCAIVSETVVGADGVQETEREVCLDPFVIEITNDPSLLVPNLMTGEGQDTADAGTSCIDLTGQDPLKLSVPPVVDAPDKLFLSEIMGPINGLLGSRGAQGGRALRRLSELGSDNFLHISVSPLYVPAPDGTCRVADVSMSWWLSKQVQKYLDHQIDVNCQAIDLATLRIRKARPTTLSPPGELCGE